MKNFNRFDEIAHLPLKVYNRFVLLSNLKEDFGEKVAQDYLEMFDEKERKQMFIINAFIKSKGVDAVRKMVVEGMEIEEEVYE